MRRAMLAGARDFLTKPPMADELVSAIRRAGEMARQERAKSSSVAVAQIPGIQGGGSAIAGGLSFSQGKVITVYSPKGGTGVTTLAVNLGITLHNEDTKVVVVDGNLQYGDVAIFLNEQGKNTILDLAPRADELEPDIVDGVLIKHQATGIRVLAAPAKPEYAEQVSGEQFGKVIDYLRRLFAYVVIDSTSMLNDVPWLRLIRVTQSSW
jgi:pilus assembly protein CpaE